MVHKKTESQDSTLNLRTNPLNIRNSDGSDLVLRRKANRLSDLAESEDNANASSTDLLVNSLVQQRHSYYADDDDGDLPHHLRVRLKKEELEKQLKEAKEKHLETTRSQLETLSVDTTTETQDNVHVPKVHRELLPKPSTLQSPIDLTSPVEPPHHQRLEQKLENKTLVEVQTGHGHSDSVTSQSSDFVPLDIDIADDDLAMDFLGSFDEFKDMNNNSSTTGLGRKDTITSTHKSRIGPSMTPSLFADKVVRTKSKSLYKVASSTDPIGDLGIPTPLLNAISFGEGGEHDNYKPPAGQLLVHHKYKSAHSLLTSGASVPSTAANTKPSTPMTSMSSGSSASSSDGFSSGSTGQLSVETQKTDNDDESVYEDAFEEMSEPPSPVIPHSPQLDELDPVDPSDRGRLFLKIHGLKDLKLPMDFDRRPRFCLTLDNGIQSVQTYPMMFPRDFNQTGFINIDQEFELMVGEGLDLVLTLSGAMDDLPKPPKRDQQHSAVKPEPPMTSQTKEPDTPKKKKKFSLFSSPGKKKNSNPDGSKSPNKKTSKHSKQDSLVITGNQIAAAAATEAASKQKPAVDVWKDTVGPKGEFARVYISEQDFEKDIYGREKSYNLSSFNEWVCNKVPIKDEHTGVVTGGFKTVREPPRRIGGLKVTMLYVPRLCRSEPIPRSLKECTEELQKALKMHNTKVEGALSQEGGDCVYWRRRWFTLDGDSMIGHTEETRKVRNIINVGNIKQIIEMDKAPEDEDPCINEERAFRLVFKNGEKMSFYADSVADKDRWVQTLRSAMVRAGGRLRSWTDLVIRQRELESQEQSAFAKRYDHHLKEKKARQYNQSGGMFIETL